MNPVSFFKWLGRHRHCWVILGMVYLNMWLSIVKVNAQSKLQNIEAFDIIKSLPTSQEAYLLLKQQKCDFNQKLNKKPKKIKFQQIASPEVMAMNLGAMSSKVLYAEMYGKRERARSFLVKMKVLMDSLQVKTISSFTSLYQYVNKSKDLDYLVFRTGSFIEQIKDYCFKQGKIKQLILIYSGDWVESMYLMLSETIKKNKIDLKHRLLEQALIIEQLIYMYRNFDKNKLIGLVKQEVLSIDKVIKQAKVIGKNGKPDYSRLSKRRLRKMLKAIKRIRFKMMHLR